MDKEKITFDDYFSNYTIYTDSSIVDINENGILLESSVFINFNDCADHFNQMYDCSAKCIGDRDITEPSFSFYTSPKPTVIKFTKHGKIREFFTSNNAEHRFQRLQKRLIELGFSTRDIS